MVKGKWHWKRTNVIQAGLLSFLVGLWLAKYGWSVHYQILLAIGLLLIFLPRYHGLRWVIITMVGLVGGIWRGQIYLQQLQPIAQRLNQAVQVEGVVKDETIFTDNRQSEFHIENLHFMPGNIASAGRLTIRGFAGNKINRGDVVHVQGKLQAARGSSLAQISFAKIKITGRHDSTLENWRRRFVAGARTALAEPEATLGLGFIVGGRTQLPDDLQNQLSATGLTHIVAVSGFNLTILVRATRRLLAGKSKYFSTISALGLIATFVAITGNSPSIARAAVVSIIALSGWYYGRPLKPTMLILLAATITASYRPLYLWYDLGWALSFLAFAGVLMLAPAVMAKFKISRKSPQIVLILIETLSAQALTLPLIIHIFGEVSLIAPLANLIVLPLIPIAMLLTLVAGMAGILMPAVVGWLAWPAQQLLLAIVQAVQKMASLPIASTKFSFSLAATITIYIALAIIIFTVRYQIGNKQLAYSIIE